MANKLYLIFSARAYEFHTFEVEGIMSSVIASMKANQQLKGRLLKIAKYFYIALAVALVCGFSWYLYTKMSRPVASVLVFLGGTIAAYFYYVKWFVIPKTDPVWPQYQAVCPDYLTPVAPGSSGDNGGAIKCVDFIGVSTNGSLKRADPTQLDSQINNPAYFFQVAPGDSSDSLKQSLIARGLTWVSLFGDN